MSPTKVLVVIESADAQSVPLELAAQIRDRGVHDVTIACYRGRNPFFPGVDGAVPVTDLGAAGALSVRAVKQLNDLISETQPDLIHLHLWPSGIWAVLLGALRRRQLVKTEHNDVRFQPLSKRITNFLLFPFLDRLIANSSSTLESLGSPERFAIRRRGLAIYNGVDFRRIDLVSSTRAATRRELGLGDTFTIGTVGRFVEQKNYRALVGAFAQVAHPGLRLLLVGDGPLRRTLEEEASVLGVSQNLVFTGAAKRDDVYRYLQAMDAFVVPSLWEGFCNAVVEAAGAGLPIAASSLGVLHEVLGRHPVYFDPHSPTDIARAISEIVDMSEEARRAFGDAASTFVRERYDLEITAERYESEFSSLVNREAGRRRPLQPR